MTIKSRIGVLAVAVCFLTLFSSCKNESGISSTSVDDLSFVSGTSVNINNKMSKNEKVKVKDTKNTQINPFFNTDIMTDSKYEGQMFFDSFKDVNTESLDILLDVKQIKEFKDGDLFQIKIKKIKGINIPSKRLSIGYFYVTPDSITRLMDDEGNRWTIKQETLKQFIKTGKIPKKSIVVCQKKDVADSKPKKANSWHNSIKVDEDTVEYNAYKMTRQGHSVYYWESMKWERNLGLIEYSSGYKSGENYISFVRA